MQTEIPTSASRKRGAKTATKKQLLDTAKISTPVGTAKIAPPIVATDYMTTREAAAYLKLSWQFLEAARYRGDGRGPPYIKLERAVRYRRSVLDAWMSSHDHSPDQPI